MGTRIKTFDSSGIAPGGRLFAADLNGIQDQYADIVNYAQTLGAGTYAIGDSGLQLVKFGTGEVRLTSKFRTDGTIMAFNDISARLSGDTNPRVIADTALNGIQFGPGNIAPDVNLYRFAANALKTDDSFDATSYKVAGAALASTHLSDLASLATQAELDTHKTSTDHDGRYFTESEIGTFLAGKLDASRPLCIVEGILTKGNAGSPGDMHWDTELYDNNGMHDPFGSFPTHVEIHQNGIYIVVGWAQFPADADGYRDMFLQTSDGAIGGATSDVDVAEVINLSAVGIAEFTTSDWVSMPVYQTSGGSMNISGRLAVHKIM